MTTLEMSPEEAVRTPLGDLVNAPFFVTVSELEALHIRLHQRLGDLETPNKCFQYALHLIHLSSPRLEILDC